MRQSNFPLPNFELSVAGGHSFDGYVDECLWYFDSFSAG